MSTTLTTRTARSGRCVRSNCAAARVSRVGTSPAQARTTSGSRVPSSVPAQSQTPRPRAQWTRASSIVSQSKQGCLPATITLT